MLRKIIAGTAVAGAMTFGAVGLAGAATPSPSGNSGGRGAALCAKLPQVQSLVTQWQSDLSAFLPKVQAIESQAKADGFTKVANAIDNRLSKLQNRESNVNARLAKIQARCQAGSSNGASN